MRPPLDTELIICPRTGEKHRPASVWETKEHGHRVIFGIFAKHGHKLESRDEEEICDWSGLAVRVEAEKAEVVW